MQGRDTSGGFWLRLVRRRWVLALLLLSGTALAVPFAALVGVDNGVDIWFVRDDPALAAYKSFHQTFGNDEVVVVAIRPKAGVWSAEGLDLVGRVSRRVEAVEGVRRVLSLATTTTITPTGTALDVSPLLSGKPVDEAAVAAVKARFEADPLLEKGLVGKGGKVALVMAEMEALADIDSRRDGIITGIEAALAAEGQRGADMSGIGVIYNALNRISQSEGAAFAGASQLAIFLLLFGFFRRVGPVLLAIAAVVLAMLWTMGLYGAFGRDINMVTMVLPTLVLVIGVADSVHILHHHSIRGGGNPGRTLRSIGVPCLFTTLTTMAGFAALGTSKMAVVRDLGLFAAAGIGFALVTTVCIIVLGLKVTFFRPLTVPAPEGPRRLTVRISALTEWSLRRRGTVLGGLLLFVLLSTFGLTRIEVDTYSLGFLPDDHETVRATKAIEAEVGPFTPLELTYTASKKDGLKEPAVLAAVARWQDAFEADPRVHATISLADVAARLHQVLSGGEARVPEDANQLWQALELYEQDADNQRAYLADSAYQQGRMTAFVSMSSSKGFESLIKRAEELAEEHMPDGVEVRPAGYLPLYVQMMDYVVESQVTSFAAAFLVIFVLMGVLFRSLRVAAISILPNMLPVFAMLGLMGLAGITLDVATVTITAIVLGIAVDDTIHYMYRYRKELRASGGDYEQAALRTAVRAGPAIAGTTLLLCIGFLVLIGATVKSVFFFGLLSSFAFAVALVGDLVVLPALLAVLRPKI
jgi:uncharacterized protein